MANGSCVDAECTNFFCSRCGTANHLATTLCVASDEIENINIISMLLERGHLMQCPVCQSTHEWAGGCNHIT